MFIISDKTFASEYKTKLDVLMDAGKAYNKARADFIEFRMKNTSKFDQIVVTNSSLHSSPDPTSLQFQVQVQDQVHVQAQTRA